MNPEHLRTATIDRPDGDDCKESTLRAMAYSYDLIKEFQETQGFSFSGTYQWKPKVWMEPFDHDNYSIVWFITYDYYMLDVKKNNPWICGFIAASLLNWRMVDI